MDMQPVQSSQISHIGYDAASKRLHVQFKRGGLYEYTGVEPETHRGLMESESKGHFFHEHVRNVHPHKKLEVQP